MGIGILMAMIVSIDALFIGVSFGANKKCRFIHIILINTFLFFLCIGGYFLALLLGELIDFEINFIIGTLFILLGLWIIISQFIQNKKTKPKDNNPKETNQSSSNIWITGFFMSVEALFITIGLTLTLNIYSIVIPLTIALAHFTYSLFTFILSKHLRNINPIIAHIISGSALVIYGIMSLLF